MNIININKNIEEEFLKFENFKKKKKVKCIGFDVVVY